MNTFKLIVVASTAFVAFATVPFAQAADTMTADQHAAMASELQQKADIATQKAAIHKAMARTPGSSKAAPSNMKAHCEPLIAQYEADAAKYSAEAAQHAKLAGTVTLSREQHLALAQEYEAKAAAANKKVAEHEAMARRTPAKGSQASMENHCEDWIAQYKAEAESYTAKATEHRLAAK